MPKMTHPNAARPLSVQADEVEARLAAGWTEVTGSTAPKVVEEQAVAATAVTRESASTPTKKAASKRTPAKKKK
jgi:hypothetical protein